MAAPSFVNPSTGSSGTTNGAGSTSVTNPTNATTGDILIVTMAIQSATTVVTMPSGWSKITADNTSNASVNMWAYRILQAGDGTSWSFSFGAGTPRFAWTCDAYRPAAGTNFNAYPFDATNVVTVQNPGTVTTLHADATVLYLFCLRSTVGQMTTAPDAATTERADVTTTNAASPWYSTETADETKATAGATTARTFTTTNRSTGATLTTALVNGFSLVAPPPTRTALVRR